MEFFSNRTTKSKKYRKPMGIKTTFKFALCIMLFVWWLAFRWVSWSAASPTGIAKVDDGISPPKYVIPLDVIPEGQIKVIGRNFYKERIINDKNEESLISIEALREFGEEMRHLMAMGKYHLGQIGGTAAKEAPIHSDGKILAFRKRLHARAPWLKGSPEDPNWPLSVLPKPVPGKAIIICAGNKQLQYLKNLIYSIRVIHSSSIPIRVTFQDDNDLSIQSQNELSSFLPDGIPAYLEFINLSKVFNLSADTVNLKAGWNLKPFGLLAVPETEIISLDVDIILLQSPDKIFEMKGYQETGAYFCHDRMFLNLNGFYDPSSLAKALRPNLSSRAENIIHYTNKDYTLEHIQESGLVVIDKSRRILGVLGICLLLGREDIRRYAQAYYSYGDKEFYWIGFETVDEPYSYSRYYPGVFGSVTTNFGGKDTAISPKDPALETSKQLIEANADNRALCGRVVHFDDDNIPLWSNGGYFTKEEDWASSSHLAKYPLNPLWYIDGGDSLTEEFVPQREQPSLLAKAFFLSWFSPKPDKEQKVIEKAFKDWESAIAKGKANQFWKTHGGMGVMCLLPNARGIREVPKELASAGTQAVKRFFLEEKGMQKEYGNHWQ